MGRRQTANGKREVITKLGGEELGVCHLPSAILQIFGFGG